MFVKSYEVQIHTYMNTVEFNYIYVDLNSLPTGSASILEIYLCSLMRILTTVSLSPVLILTTDNAEVFV